MGGTDLEWKLKFPEDNQILMQNYSNNLQQVNNDLLKKQILEKQIFMVSPKKGKLDIEEEGTVELTYRTNLEDEIYDKKGERKLEEQHALETIFSIQNGKTIKLEFKGTTIAPIQSRLII